MKLLTCLLIATLLPSVFGQEQAAAPATPKVTASSPKAWEIGASSSTKELSITFDQRMSPGYTAWIGRSSVVPQLDLETKISEDRKTFSLRVNLQPGKVYAFALNEKKIPGVGFQNERGQSAPPYFLVFQTAGNPAPNDAPPRAISTIPTANAQQLDPAKLKSLTVTFDNPMQTAKHGLHMTENRKEVDLSKARFQYSSDGKSFTLAYDFKASSTYEFDLNSTQDIGFASATRIPLWPVRFAFTTGSAR